MSQKRSTQELERRKVNRAKKLSVVCFQDVLLSLMAEWKVEMADIQKATQVPWSTLWEWTVKGKTPMLDGNILALSQYFQCTINYLAFGIGEDPTPPNAPEPIKPSTKKPANKFRLK